MIVYEGHRVIGSSIKESIFQDAPKIELRATSTSIVEVHVQWNVEEGRLIYREIEMQEYLNGQRTDPLNIRM